MQLTGLRKLATNYAFLSAGETASKILTFAAFTFLARVLGPADFGSLEFTLALIIFFVLAIDCGLGSYGARELAKNPSGARELINQVTSLRLFFALGGFLVLFFLAMLLGLDRPARILVLLYSLTLFGIPFFHQWIFQGFEKMQWVGLGSALRYLIFALGVFLLIRKETPLWMVGFVEIVAVSVFVLYNISVSRFLLRLPRPRLILRPSRLAPSIRQALPIGMSELSWAFTFYFPTVLLGIIVGGQALGWFSAAHRCIMALHTFVWLYFFNLLPSISRAALAPAEKFQDLMRHSLRGTLWLAVFIGVIGNILATPLIGAIFGQQFRGAGEIFRVLVWVLSVSLWSGHYRYALIGFNQQRLEFLAAASAAATSIVAGIALIPRYGAIGAAVSLLAAALVHGGLAYVFVRRNIAHVPFAPHAFRPLCTGAVTVAMFLLLLPTGVWMASVFSVALYGVAFLLLEPGLLGTLAVALARNPGG